MNGVGDAARGHPAELSFMQPMITLTRLNGKPFVVNAEKIRYVEQTPDTMVCCDHGEKIMVKETLQDVIRKSIEYARLIRKAVTD